MKLVFFILLFSFNLFALETYKYQGVARDKEGKFLYKETHLEKWQAGEIISTVTRYFNQEDKEIAILSNDFTKSVSFPEFSFKNHEDLHEHGVVFKDRQYEMYMINDGEKKTKVYKPKDESVTGQGFHFSLVKKLDMLKLSDTGVFDFVIPGRLTSYKFAYKVIKKTESEMTIKVSINNFFLRMIAPSMQLRYNSKTKRLIDYEGLSNIYQKQSVKIVYQHD
jgi:hypothetical protein